MKDPSNPVCRTISTLLSRIGDKWTVLVVSTLGEGSKRFNELRREIPSVSQRMLTLTLRNLERDGLVNRTVTPTIPALLTANCRAAAYAPTLSPAATAGAVIVPVAAAVEPVMVRLVPGFTVASAPKL